MQNAIKSADILLPKENIDIYKYSCVACDQFTGDADYWKNAEKTAENSFSALNMIFPEIYLSNDNSERTAKINKTMNEYIEKDIFREYKDSVIYVERTLKNGKIRHGIVAVCDLEQYDYGKNTRSFVRPTEGTIEDRLPPRVAIRENAPLELPHIMLLINDETKSIIEGLANKEKTLVYDSPLMLDGGSIKGWVLDRNVQNGLLSDLEKAKVGTEDNQILFAVGDGNHSLATAKKCWEKIKTDLTEKERENHPARFALCEIVNLHDDSLLFEPIHRILYNVDTDKFLSVLESNRDEGSDQICTVIVNGEEKKISLSPTHSLTVGTLQNIIDSYLAENQGQVDYIHEPEQVRKNAENKNSVGLLIEGLEKSQLFPSVIANGALPRKTFSMGMGIDKRYYLEARKIK